MSTGIWSAASGAVSQTTVLDVQSNNVANAATPGYRADRAVFRQTLARAVDRSMGTGSMRYNVARSVEPDFAVGQIVHTGRALDVALTDDQGLFAVSTPQGERYTRAGSIRVTAEGRLVTQSGLSYLDTGHKPIRVPEGASVSISQEGKLLVDGEPLGPQLLVVTFPNLRGLEKEGDFLLRAGANAGRLVVHQATLAEQSLELSNSSAVQGMSGLVAASRQFDMLARVIEAFSTIERRAATDIMKQR